MYEFKVGDVVRLDFKKIMGDNLYRSGTNEYRKFILNNFNTEFTINHIYEDTAQLKENNRWFWSLDYLIKVK